MQRHDPSAFRPQSALTARSAPLRAVWLSASIGVACALAYVLGLAVLGLGLMLLP